ncbi:MAG TPA: hypothetical protein DIT04_05765 [Dysgonomonas sp.]|nr:hypothetical protein [Dysgonomonas sp.]
MPENLNKDNMNIKYFLLIGCLLLCSINVFSQEEQRLKYEFKYKSVNGHDIMATIYLPESNNKTPVLIYFHGGGFIFGNRNQGLEELIRDKLLANNIAVVSADYRLAPGTKLDGILEDVRDVITWIKDKGEGSFNINTNKVAVGGGSAGGYLALSTGFEPHYAPNAIISISAPTGFSTEGIKPADLSLLNDTWKGSIVSHGDYASRMDLWRQLGKNGLALYEIFGFDPAKEPEKLGKYTLTNNIKTGYPPTLIVHAKNDRAVKFDEAKAFHMFLQDKQIESELYIVENGHSSELIKQHPEAVEEIVAFLNRQFE